MTTAKHGEGTHPGEDHLAMVRRLMAESIPFHRWLGVQLTEVAPGTATLTVPFRPELVGDPDRPALHGGVLSAIADAAGGAAVWTRIGPYDRVSTVDLRVDYLRPARLELFVARATVLRVGNRVGVADVILSHPGDVEPIAHAKGVYSLHRADDPSLKTNSAGSGKVAKPPRTPRKDRLRSTARLVPWVRDFDQKSARRRSLCGEREGGEAPSHSAKKQSASPPGSTLDIRHELLRRGTRPADQVHCPAGLLGQARERVREG